MCSPVQPWLMLRVFAAKGGGDEGSQVRSDGEGDRRARCHRRSHTRRGRGKYFPLRRDDFRVIIFFLT